MDTSRWAAVVARNKASDGLFVYSVRTTKIYCRPTCGARLPRRNNVGFFDTPSLAEAAGFRACKRCKPDLVSYTPQDDVIRKACDTICLWSLGDENPSLETLATQAGLTKHHFHRMFKRKTGLTPRQFAMALRADDGTPHLVPVTTDASEATTAAGDINKFDTRVNSFDLFDTTSNDSPIPILDHSPLSYTSDESPAAKGTESDCPAWLGIQGMWALDPTLYGDSYPLLESEPCLPDFDFAGGFT